MKAYTEGGKTAYYFDDVDIVSPSTGRIWSVQPKDARSELARIRDELGIRDAVIYDDAPLREYESLRGTEYDQRMEG